MNSIITETRHEITASDIYRYDRCLELFLTPEEQPCPLCPTKTKTACMRLRVARKNHKSEVPA